LQRRQIAASGGERYGDVTTKRVLVTGASGFVGRPLVTALLRAGYAVRAATRRPASFPKPVEVVIVPDFTNPIDWKPILQGADIVVHLAGLVHADDQHISYSVYDHINRATTQELARAANETRLDRFVYISSVRAQSGPSATHVVNEYDPSHPTDHYGRSKLAAESAIRSTGIPFTILRPVVVYGPHAKGNIRRLYKLSSSPFPLPFKGFTNRRSFLALDNLIAAIIFTLNNQTTVDEEFLVADPTPLTLPELIAMLRKAQGRKSGLVYVPSFFIRLALLLSGQWDLWERLSESLVVDTGKLESLGWRPVVDTYEGLRAALAAENDKGW
jgi:UDP-glucose 4-epimerase